MANLRTSVQVHARRAGPRSKSRSTLEEQVHNRKGFTIAELLISVAILALIITFASTVYINFYGSVQNLKAMNLVYEEARFTMERITKEIRNGTIDYEEYYNQALFCSNWAGSCEFARNTTYGQDYCQYSLQFYNPGADGEIGTIDDDNTGRLAASATNAIENPIQDNLFLININGDRRSYIKRIEETDSVTGETIGKVGLLKLQGGDFGIDHIEALASTSSSCDPDPGENDGRIDTWLCEEGFNCPTIELFGIDSCTGEGNEIIYDPARPDETSYVDITPTALDIVDLKFIISPANDPRKAFNQDEFQIQPHITIKLVARANPKIASEFERDKVPNIILESTISARAQNEILTECNLKQCFPGSTKSCPKSAGVCGPDDDDTDSITGPAVQTCSDEYLWTGCQTIDYQKHAESEWGDEELYEENSEFASCGENTTCRTAKCTDTYDNDCNGSADGQDPNCKFYLCTNGSYDGEDVEEIKDCPDVGGICQQIHPYQAGREVSCYDGYDNDCDGFADEFDADCIRQLCTNGEHDPLTNTVTHQFLIRNYGRPNYLLDADPDDDYVTNFDERCDADSPSVDIGGICDLCKTDDTKTEDKKGSCVCGSSGCSTEKIIEGSEVQAEETGTLCYDGLDNDCDELADELDSDCQATICEDDRKNCDLAPDSFSTPEYLVNYSSTTCDYPLNTNDEVCKNVGGVCDGYVYPNAGAGRYEDHTYVGPDDGSKGENKKISGSYEDYSSVTPDYLCQDGLDNDCDGGIDWADDDCCPDDDGDGYIGKSAANNCFYTGEDADCAEGDINKHPGATEDCTNGEDDDCDGDSDNTDSACCVDTDGDGWGIPLAYTSCTKNSQADCDDTDSGINPQIEETGELCMNQDGGSPINDDCNTETFTDPEHGITEEETSERANHIDWYRDKPGGIWNAFIHRKFEPNCCDTGADEICNDDTWGVYGSDEDCNGLEGYDDDYCIVLDSSDKRIGLFDNFELPTNIANKAVTIADLDGSIKLSAANTQGIVTSRNLADVLDLSCASGDYEVLFVPEPNYIMPADTMIQFQLSGDNGATWCGYEDITCDGTDWITMSEIESSIGVSFSDPDYDLKWRAQLISTSATNIPVLEDLTITFVCL